MSREKHLELIQGVINRMAANSFHLKGWSVVLVSALFALAGKEKYVYFVYLAYVPAIVFWGLDGYFLRQERLFRKLYDAVRAKDGEESDFSMNTNDYKDDVDCWSAVCLSRTLAAFHGALLVAIIIVMVLTLALGS
jgi:hypothetical protein